MELLLVGGAIYVFTRNAFYKEPEPEDGNKEGTSLPAPRFLYSEPRIWTSSPVDVTYRPSQRFYGPNNDPRFRYQLYGGARVVHSGYNPVVRTNQVWASSVPKEPSAQPGYTSEPIKGTGEKQVVTSKTVFKD
jgi:hypothetical protein